MAGKHSIKKVLLTLLAIVVIAVLLGYYQYCQLVERNRIEWAYEAYDAQLVFDPEDPHARRWLLSGVTDVGKQMVTDYQYRLLAGQAVPNQQRYGVLAAAVDEKLLHRYAYLDVFAWLEARILYWLRYNQAPTFLSTRHANEAIQVDSIKIETLFTQGERERADTLLGDRLQRLLQQAKSGSYVRFSLFLFFYENPDESILLSLLEAAERGVHVQLLLNFPEADREEEKQQAEAYFTMLQQRMAVAAKTGNSESWVKRHARIGDGIKDHNKIFLFSDSDNQQHWVLLSSENLTDSARHKHQAGVLVRDQQLYDQLTEYWFAIKDGYFSGQQSQPDNQLIQAMLYPRYKGEDNIYSLLKNIALANNNSLHKGDVKKGILRLSMPRWSFERLPIAYKLVKLAQQGLQVEVITRSNARIVDEQVLAVLASEPNIQLLAVDAGKYNIHSKYWLYEGWYPEATDQFSQQKIVWVGSHNFTGMALRENYESILQIKHEPTYQQFVDNFDLLKRTLIERDLL